MMTPDLRFLGHAPRWYSATILTLLALNIPLFFFAGPVITAWAVLLEFIFTLAMALKCYPLAPGGLIALEAVLLGLTTPESVYDETLHGVPVILLLVFMVTAIHFMRELLMFLFTRVLTAVRSPTALALLFCSVSALLSAFLDALTVLAVVITVAIGFHHVYMQTAPQEQSEEAEQFRASLRGLMMHASVGTALGGVMTIVGEPQNLLIGHEMGWEFMEFFRQMAHVTIPVFIAGLVTCAVVDKFRLFGFGTPIPSSVRELLVEADRREAARRTSADRRRFFVQGVCGAVLIVALALHVAEIGLIGLTIVVLLAAFLGLSDEHTLADGFKGAMPFTALLVVFFAVVAVIHSQHLFSPVMQWVLAQQDDAQVVWLYLANGLLSAVSDNVFVATIYITEIKRAFTDGAISAQQMNDLAVAINVGTNIPSIATPNGQAAFLFLLTSALAPLIRLSYGRMVWMALPYFLVTTTVGLLFI